MEKLRNNVLGRGLGALFNDNKTELLAPKSSILEIDLEHIFVNPLQPRKYFDKEKIEELASSIKEHGIIQPITVRKIENNHYQLISGERRVRASRFLCLKTIPAYIRKIEEDKILEMALIENIQRSDLNPIEIALSYQKLVQSCNLTQEEIARRVGKKRSTVTNFLRILSLPDIIKKAISECSITMGHAKALISLEVEGIQAEVLKRIINKGLSVRETESMCRKMLQKHDNKKINRPNNIDSDEAQSMPPPGESDIEDALICLMKKLDVKINVNINDEEIHINSLSLESLREANFKKGQLIINFDSIEKLNEILNTIKK